MMHREGAELIFSMIPITEGRDLNISVKASFSFSSGGLAYSEAKIYNIGGPIMAMKQPERLDVPSSCWTWRATPDRKWPAPMMAGQRMIRAFPREFPKLPRLSKTA